MPQPDPKPPEPIQLKELMERFASAVVNTSYQLDEANVELRNLYLSSDNLDLSAMSPSRYVLDEVRIDLSFVVKEAKPDILETHQLPEEHKKVNKDVLRPVNPSLLHAKLVDAANADALTDALKKTAPMEDRIKQLEKELADGREALRKARDALKEVARRPHDDPERHKRSQEWLQLYHQFCLPIRGQAEGSKSRELRENIEKVRQEKAPLDDAIKLLSGKLPLTNEQIENLRKLGIPFNHWDEKWDQFYRKYELLRNTYADAVKAFQKHTSIPQIDNFQLTDQDRQVLQQITEKGADWNGVRAWVIEIRNDYDATLAALNALLQLMADIRGSGLKVRIDREAVAAAPVETRQKINFTFHGRTQETVKIKQADRHKQVVI